MKKLIFLLVIHSFVFNGHSQVKIGAPGDPDINAVLELAGSSKGLLLPRVALTSLSSATPLSAFVAGMVVYNTANVSDVRPGYYYSDGLKWIRISNSLETWSLDGNVGTNPSTQFLGTTDLKDFSIRTTNLERIRITSSGMIAIGTNSVINSRLRVNGTISTSNPSLLLLDGLINPNVGGSSYSIRNTPSFGTATSTSQVFGTYTEFSYSGNVTALLAGEVADISTDGSNDYNLVTGVYGSASRSSSGINDGSYFGGHFRSRVLGNDSGAIDEVAAIFGNADVSASGSPTIGNFGGLYNLVSNTSSNSSVSVMYGVKNLITKNGASTVPNVYGFYNTVTANSNAILSNCYGTYTNLQANSTASITSAYGHYLAAPSGNIGNYRGIFIGNIPGGSGVRRAFEYSGTGTNDPVIINYDGSVVIGTLAPVANAKLSIYDGHLQSGQTIKPVITAFGTIGTGGSASLVDATDVAGFISLDLGSGAWGIFDIARVTFNKAYVTAPVVVITPTNVAAAIAMINQRPFITSTTTTFTINFASAATSGDILTFSYHVIETVNN